MGLVLKSLQTEAFSSWCLVTLIPPPLFFPPTLLQVTLLSDLFNYHALPRLNNYVSSKQLLLSFFFGLNDKVVVFNLTLFGLTFMMLLG